MENATVDAPEFNDEELGRVLKEVGEQARREAFAVGRPVMTLKGKDLVLLYADGQEEVVGSIGLNTIANDQNEAG